MVFAWQVVYPSGTTNETGCTIVRSKIRVTAKSCEPRTIVATLTDQTLCRVAVPLVFFYRHRVDKSKLVSSLEQVLSHYPEFASSPMFRQGKLVLECDNRGVDISFSERDKTIRDVIPSIIDHEWRNLVDTLHPGRVLRSKQPVLTLKISYFKCGGMSIGACWHHAVGDMYSFMLFYRAWIAAISNMTYDLPYVVGDRDVYLEDHLPSFSSARPGYRYLESIDLVKLLAYMVFKARNHCTVQIYFSDAELEEMKKAYSEEAGLSLSTNDAICAHMFHYVANSDVVEKKRFLSVAVDYRARMSLPVNLVGNTISAINLELEPQEKTSRIAARLRTAVEHFEDHMDYHVNKAMLERIGGAAKIHRLVPYALDPLNGNLLVTNWRNQGVYDAAICGEKPVYFTPIPDVPFPWGSAIVEGPESKGVIYTVTLPRVVARNLLEKYSLEIHRFRDAKELLPENLHFLH